MTPYAAGADCALGWYFAGFGLLGIGNTAIQVAVNPLLATIVPGERMTSYLTVGQIFRNTSLLLLAPIVTGLVAATGSWRSPDRGVCCCRSMRALRWSGVSGCN